MLSLPCLCHSGYLRFAVGAQWGPISTNIQAIMATVATWMAAWCTTSWKASDSSISAFHLLCACDCLLFRVTASAKLETFTPYLM